MIGEFNAAVDSFLMGSIVTVNYYKNENRITVKPLYYAHTRDPKISLYLIMRSLSLTFLSLIMGYCSIRRDLNSVSLTSRFIY
jgi:hypothetical protein